jgi:hypothetical protein
MEDIQPIEPPVGINTTTKADLLCRAKDAIDAGETRLHEAAEALALAQKDFKATQREIATAIGRSASWVNRLLKWRRSGYKEHSPFGPTTTAARVSHGKQRTKASPLRKTNTAPKADTSDDAHDSGEQRKREYAEEEAETRTSAGPQGSTLQTEHEVDADDDAQATVDKRKPDERLEAEPETATPASAQKPISRTRSPAEAKGELRWAIDHYWPLMDDAGRAEITAYFLKKAGVRA